MRFRSWRHIRDEKRLIKLRKKRKEIKKLVKSFDILKRKKKHIITSLRLNRSFYPKKLRLVRLIKLIKRYKKPLYSRKFFFFFF